MSLNRREKLLERKTIVPELQRGSISQEKFKQQNFFDQNKFNRQSMFPGKNLPEKLSIQPGGGLQEFSKPDRHLKEIFDFLENVYAEQQIVRKGSNLTQKDAQMIIFNLLTTVVPNYEQPPAWNTVNILKLFNFLGCPYQIRPDAITAVGAPNSVGYLVRAVYWLYQQISILLAPTECEESEMQSVSNLNQKQNDDFFELVLSDLQPKRFLNKSDCLTRLLCEEYSMYLKSQNQNHIDIFNQVFQNTRIQIISFQNQTAQALTDLQRIQGECEQIIQKTPKVEVVQQQLKEYELQLELIFQEIAKQTQQLQSFDQEQENLEFQINELESYNESQEFQIEQLKSKIKSQPLSQQELKVLVNHQQEILECTQQYENEIKEISDQVGQENLQISKLEQEIRQQSTQIQELFSKIDLQIKIEIRPDGSYENQYNFDTDILPFVLDQQNEFVYQIKLVQSEFEELETMIASETLEISRLEAQKRQLKAKSFTSVDYEYKSKQTQQALENFNKKQGQLQNQKNQLKELTEVQKDQTLAIEKNQQHQDQVYQILRKQETQYAHEIEKIDQVIRDTARQILTYEQGIEKICEQMLCDLK